MRVCGLMSGTSLDGLDIAVVDFSYKEGYLKHELLFFQTMSYDASLKAQLQRLMDMNVTVSEVSSMNMYLGELYATLAKEAIASSDLDYESIDLISSHGQTIWHQPIVSNNEFSRPNTLQIGDISVIAEYTGKSVIGDFRTRDMAAGGQGAPLVPFVDELLFRIADHGRVIANIGGIANITVLAPLQKEVPTIAYDTGPGNMVIDELVALYTAGKKQYDANGEIASKGKVNSELLQRLLNNEYFNLMAPKSTGRELFGKSYAQHIWSHPKFAHLSPEDKIATVTMLTAKTLVDEVMKYSELYEVKQLFISGGGIYNSTLLTYIEQNLPSHIQMYTTETLGVQGDAKEAFIFALLGFLGFHKLPNNLPSATGANRQTILGKIAW